MSTPSSWKQTSPDYLLDLAKYFKEDLSWKIVNVQVYFNIVLMTYIKVKLSEYFENLGCL